MVKNVKNILKTLSPQDTMLALPAIALRSVTSRTGKGVYASSDKLFKDAVFGRDSLEVAEDLMGSRPRLVKNIILTLASLQGTVANKDNEEEPGRIIHEYRSININGKKINQKSQEILETLSSQWGGTPEELAYYGSVDATPLFVRVLDAYCGRYGEKILKVQVTRRDDSQASVAEVVRQSIDWVEKKLEQSRSGLLEYQRVNPKGLMNQVWKDSNEFYTHKDGTLANHDGPIASIEVQALAYDALMAAGRFDEQNESKYQARARELRDHTIKLLWQEDKKYFALGTDFSEAGELRTIDTKTANPAALLDSGFFEELSDELQKKYVGAIAETIVGRDFITDAGVRSRALSEAHLVGHWDYHGSYVSWPKETYDIAKGLRRYGFSKLARQLESRLLNVFLKNRRYPEFVYIDDLGRVLAILPGQHSHGEVIEVLSTNNPEAYQAWTVSAIIAILNGAVMKKVKVKRSSKRRNLEWQPVLENKLLSRMPMVGVYLNPVALSARYPTYRYELRDTRSK